MNGSDRAAFIPCRLKAADRTIDVQVGRLRRKLEEDPQNPTLIKTVRGSGYIFTPTVDMS